MMLATGFCAQRTPLNSGRPIIRRVTPLKFQPVPLPQVSGLPAQSGLYGIEDMQPAFFVSPKKDMVLGGAGPQFLLRTAKSTGILGANRCLISQPRKWMVEILMNNLWSVAGHAGFAGRESVPVAILHQLQPKKGWYLTWQPTLRANWEATNGSRCLALVRGGVARIMRPGFQPVNVDLQFYGNAIPPRGRRRLLGYGQLLCIS